MNSNDDLSHDDELLLLLLVISQELAEELDRRTVEHNREERRRNRRRPRRKERPTWNSFVGRVSATHFRRMFRMPLHSFQKLCDDITTAVTVEVFRPEAFLLHGGMDGRRGSHGLRVQGGYVAGEIRAAVSLRLLAGGSYLDLVPLFDVVQSQVYDSFDHFIKWVNRTYRFPLTDWLRSENWLKLHGLAAEFGEKTGGVFYGGFGALDGLAIRMISPRMSDVKDPGNYYCRKGFYALNVQAICDKKKRFLWVNPMNKGSTHDSVAFGLSQLFDLLVEKSEALQREGLHLLGDSAYPLSSFLQVPYELPDLQSDPTRSKDSFNYYHSANRIYIECAFGELIMRWGIFWRTLRFDLLKCGKMIRVAMLLHNFIINERNGEPNDDFDDQYFRNFNAAATSASQRRLTATTGEAPRALVTDNNEPRPPGRPSTDETRRRQIGERIRNSNVLLLAHHNFRRPVNSNMRVNAHGHIYMNY